MALHSLVQLVCIAGSTGCLLLGYALAGNWPVALVLAAVALFWILMSKKSAFWASSGALVAYLGLCVVGILLNCPLPPLVLGSLSTLTWWDLTDSGQGFCSEPPGKFRRLLEKHRLQSLALMIGISLMLEAAGLWLSLQLPFGVILLLVILAMIGILYTVHQLRNSGRLSRADR